MDDNNYINEKPFDCEQNLRQGTPIRLSQAQRDIANSVAYLRRPSLPTEKKLTGICLSMGVGTGKTLTTIAIVSTLRKESRFQKSKVYIITKPVLQDTFQSNWQKCFGEKMAAKDNVIVTTYIKCKTCPVRSHDIVIIDEVHNLRNKSDGKTNPFQKAQFRNAYENAYDAGFVILLTATPMVNSVKDLQTTLLLMKAPSIRMKIDSLKHYEGGYKRGRRRALEDPEQNGDKIVFNDYGNTKLVMKKPEIKGSVQFSRWEETNDHGWVMHLKSQAQNFPSDGGLSASK